MSAAAAAAAAGAGGAGSWVTLSRLLVAAGVGFGLIALKKYANGPLSPHTPGNTDMTGKVVVITGGNAGLGRATARVLMRMNATVVLACRDAAKAAKAAAELRAEVAADAKAAAAAGDAKAAAHIGAVEPMALDVSDLQSVRAFASAFKAKYTRLHVLLNNAGIYDTAARTTTAAGHETLIATNHIGPFLLTTLLLDTLTASAPSRVVTVSSGLEATAAFDLSDLHFDKRPYANAYASSKLCNILFARELARRTEGTGVVSVSLRPGFVPSTEMSAKIPGMQWLYRGVGMPLLWPISKDLPHGIATIVHCSAAPHNQLVSGAYYGDCAVVQPRHKLATDDALARKLWEHTEQLVAAAK